MPTIILFLIFVALAVYVQNLTEFALALVLLGLVGATDLFPLPDVVNAISIIVLVNATLFLYKRRALRWKRALWPVLLSSMVGTALGVGALAWIIGNAYEILRLLLGLSIVSCAWMLWRRRHLRQTIAFMSHAVRYMPPPNIEWPITLFIRVTLGLGVRDPAIPIPMPGIMKK